MPPLGSFGGMKMVFPTSTFSPSLLSGYGDEFDATVLTVGTTVSTWNNSAIPLHYNNLDNATATGTPGPTYLGLKVQAASWDSSKKATFNDGSFSGSLDRACYAPILTGSLAPAVGKQLTLYVVGWKTDMASFIGNFGIALLAVSDGAGANQLEILIFDPTFDGHRGVHVVDTAGGSVSQVIYDVNLGSPLLVTPGVMAVVIDRTLSGASRFSIYWNGTLMTPDVSGIAAPSNTNFPTSFVIQGRYTSVPGGTGLFNSEISYYGIFHGAHSSTDVTTMTNYLRTKFNV